MMTSTKWFSYLPVHLPIQLLTCSLSYQPLTSAGLTWALLTYLWSTLGLRPEVVFSSLSLWLSHWLTSRPLLNLLPSLPLSLWLSSLGSIDRSPSPSSSNHCSPSWLYSQHLLTHLLTSFFEDPLWSLAHSASLSPLLCSPQGPVLWISILLC